MYQIIHTTYFHINKLKRYIIYIPYDFQSRACQPAWCMVGKVHQDGTDERQCGGIPGFGCKDFHMQEVWSHKAQAGKSQQRHSGKSAPQNWSAST